MKVLLFDFDGLILDTETPEVRAWEAVFSEYGQVFPFDWVIRNLGRGREQIDEWPEDILSRQVPRLSVDEARRIGRERCLANIGMESVRPGIVRLLDEAGAENIPCAVVSSSQRDWVQGHLERFGLVDRFVDFITAERTLRAKPHPDLYQFALSLFGLAPSEALALEDSPNGIAAARSADVCVVAIPNDVSKHFDLTHANHHLETLEGVGVADLRSIWSSSLKFDSPDPVRQ